jgi:hypothetical protein
MNEVYPVTNNTAAPMGTFDSGSLAWLVSFRSLGEIVHDEPTFLLCELEFYVLCILTYMHAHRHGGRYLWLWWTTILHGLTTELVSYWYEDIDNFWHAQSLVMWFGKREPFHIICLYPAFIYTASVALARLRMVENCEPFAAGLFEVLLDVPYDVMGVKLLWWTWHDTDANIYDRAYGVPWTSYFFHMSFGMAFTFLLQRSRRYFTGVSGLYSDDEMEAMPYRKKQMAGSFWGEFAVMVIVGLFSFPLGVMLQFVPLYHIPHDIFGIHSEICVGVLVLFYVSTTLWGIFRAQPVNLREDGEREERRSAKRRGPGKWHVDECFVAVVFHYVFYMLLVVGADPTTVRATGLHQPIAPVGCHSPMVLEETVGLVGLPNTPNEAIPWFGDITREKYYDPSLNLTTKVRLRYGPYEVLPFPGRPVVVERNHSICPSNFSEDTHEFWCVEENRCRAGMGDVCRLPTAGAEWYTICGTAYVDDDGTGGLRSIYPEYVMMLLGLCSLSVYLFAAILAYPRTIFDIVWDLKLPRYYKIEGEPTSGNIVSIRGKKINKVSGREEYLVKRNKGSQGWEPKHRIVSDGTGPIYGERGGLYGIHGVHAETSSRERLRMYDSHRNAVERISLWKKKTCEKDKTM